MASGKDLQTHLSSSPQTEASARRKDDAATGLSAASTRAVAARAMAFYFRAPARSFLGSRVE